MQVFVTLDGTFQTHLLRTSSGPSSGPQVTNRGYPISWDLGCPVCVACQVDDSCAVAARVSLHTTVWMLLFWCMLTTQCIEFVLLPFKVTVQILGHLGGSSSRLDPLLPQARQFIGQSEAFRVPMRGSWQVTCWKNVNFCQNNVWRKICSAPSPSGPPQDPAQDHRLLTGDILGYPSLFGDILG